MKIKFIEVLCQLLELKCCFMALVHVFVVVTNDLTAGATSNIIYGGIRVISELESEIRPGEYERYG